MSSLKVKGKFTLATSTTAEVAKCIEMLPAVQAVRGSVWPADTAEALIRDILNELYVPPIAFAGNAEDAACVDGQQRSRAIAAALKAGKLKGDEEVLVVVDNGRTVEEAFYRLNVGVPVGSSLVAAMDSGDAGKVVIAVASNAYFDSVAWSENQSRKTMRGDFAAALVAIVAGWDSPESSAKVCNGWIKSHSEAVTDDVQERSIAILGQIAEAVQPYIKEGKVAGKAGKAARSVLGKLRRKNLWMTLIGGIESGLAAKDILKAYRHEEKLCDTKYSVKGRNGKAAKVETAHWTLGAGSSGSYDEYRQRLIVLQAACDGIGEEIIPDGEKAEQNAAADVANTNTADLAAQLGVEVNV